MLKSDKIVEIISNTELFASASDEMLDYISKEMQPVELPTEELLFSEGDIGDALYLVVNGTLSIQSNGVEIVTRGIGEFVGEFALLDDLPRSATVKAKTDSFLLKLSRKDFYQAIVSSWEVTSAAFKILGKKLRQDYEHQIRLVREQQRIQQDLQRAYEVQTAMLPGEDLLLDWIHLTGKSQPATEVGGDYYDYFVLPDGRVGIAVGDVVGHGFYSGLLVAIVSSALNFQVEIDPSPFSVIDRLNRVVRDYRHTRLFMTFTYLLVDASNHEFTIASAGHPYPYFYNHDSKRWSSLEIDSPPLGTIYYKPSQVIEKDWKAGDRLFLYTDGLVEMQNEMEQMYGFERLEGFLRQYSSLSPTDMVSAVYDELDNYRKGCPFEDDVTAVVVQFRK